MSDYTRGEMEISEQSNTFDGFISASVYGTGLLIMLLIASVLIFAAGISWLIAVSVMAVVGILYGVFLKLGGGWFATVIGLSIFTFLLSGFIALLV